MQTCISLSHAKNIFYTLLQRLSGEKDWTSNCAPSSSPVLCPELVGDKEGLNHIVLNDKDHFIQPW